MAALIVLAGRLPAGHHAGFHRGPALVIGLIGAALLWLFWRSRRGKHRR